MNLGGNNGGTRFCMNDLSPFFWFWLRVETRIWFKGIHLIHQWLLWATINSVMPGALMEVAPLTDIFLHLPIVLICLQLGIVFLRFPIFSLSFFLRVGATLALLLLWGVYRPKLSRLLFKLMLDFDGISIGRAQGRNVQKLHFGLDLSMQTTMILENHMYLKIFVTQLGAQGMEDIFKLWHGLVSFLP